MRGRDPLGGTLTGQLRVVLEATLMSRVHFRITSKLRLGLAWLDPMAIRWSASSERIWPLKEREPDSKQ
jgi:hypothetical protein